MPDTCTVDRLACGRTLDEVWRGLDAEPDQHEKSCSHCRRARDNLHELHELTQQWRDAAPTDPEGQPHTDLRRSVMDVVRGEFRGGRRLALRRTDLGEITVREAAIAQIAREAAVTVPGTWARGCEVNDESGSVGIRVALSLSVSARALSPDLLTDVRRVVGSRLSRDLGIDPTLDLLVEDVHDLSGERLLNAVVTDDE